MGNEALASEYRFFLPPRWMLERDLFMTSDATPAYRGYRLQHLYSLWRILQAGDQEYMVFQLEGQEDLDILDGSGTLLDVQQVKAYDDDLTLSTFSPNKPDSFFYRIARLVKIMPHLIGSIVSFGDVGSELRKALTEDGPDRQRVAKKLSSYQLISEGDAITVLKGVRLLLVEETDLTAKVFAALRQSLTGIDPEAAFDLLSFWLYRCAERKCRLTRQDVIEKVNGVGRFLAERATHYREWFTSIIPIEDHPIDAQRERLAESFFRGVAARYDHILAGLDVRRPHKLQELAEKFAEHQAVIIHGASGQGKSTLAYRYLHEYFPNQWRFQVRAVDGREHALSIALALSGHADALGVPLAIYIDVSPRDSGWLDLIEQLSRHPQIQILVTVREEDFRRATISKADIDLETVALAFERTEAEQIYSRLQGKRQPARLLNFQDAWNLFGGDGPLMEFVYLVTQGETLRERLQEQVKRLQDDVLAQRYPPALLDLLRLVSVASAYEAQVQASSLLASLQLPAPDRVLELLEEEYLIRRSDNGLLLQGLHPIRSAILAELLTDPPAVSTWLESACTCLPFLYGSDVEPFLLYAFSRRRSEREPLLAFLSSYQTDEWTAQAGIMRALLWLGIQGYAEANLPLIREVVGKVGLGWYLVLDTDLTDANPGAAGGMWERLEHHLSTEGKKEIQAFRARQSDKEQALAHAKAWLVRQDPRRFRAPVSESDWSGLAEALFWVGHLDVQWPLEEWLAHLDLESALDGLPLDILANLVLGISHAHGNRIPDWLERVRPRLLHRFQRETQTPIVDDDGTTVTAHFLIPLAFFEENASQIEGIAARGADDHLHPETMRRITFIRNVFPERDAYASQGYGHRLLEALNAHDSTRKTGIPRLQLPPDYLTLVNGTFRGNVHYEMRPATWQEYTERILQLRKAVLSALQELERGLQVYFRKHQSMQVFGSFVDIAHWTYCQQLLRTPPLLPKCAVDEWGFVDEVSARRTKRSLSDELEQDGSERSTQPESRGLVFQEYNTLLNTFAEYTRTLSNFFEDGQSVRVMRINAALAKRENTSAERMHAAEREVPKGMNPDVFHLSTLNFGDALLTLTAFQGEFHRLLVPFCSGAELTELELQEQRVFSRLWNMWYFFAFHPQLIMSNAIEECTQRLEAKRQMVCRDVRKVFRRFAQERLQVDMLSRTVPWHREPALWITVDANVPLDAYRSGERVIAVLRKVVHRMNEKLLRRYALGFLTTYTLIVPIVQGKSLTAQAWRAFLPGLLVGDDESPPLLFPQLLPPDTLSSLGIEMWALPQAETARQGWEKTVELSLLTAHLRDIQRLPPFEEEELIRPYTDQIVARINTVLQEVLYTEKALIDRWNSLSPSEIPQRLALAQAMHHLSELHLSVLPTADFQGEVEMRQERVSEWAQRLEKGREDAYLIYLLSATNALDEKKVI